MVEMLRCERSLAGGPTIGLIDVKTGSAPIRADIYAREDGAASQMFMAIERREFYLCFRRELLIAT